MGLFSKSRPAPAAVQDTEKTQHYPQNYPGANGYDVDPKVGSDINSGDGNGYDDDLHVQCPPHTTEARLVRRIDWHVVPFLCILYLLAFLDRVNIANANVYGLSTELGLTGDKYNIALVVCKSPLLRLDVLRSVCADIRDSLCAICAV